MNVLQKLLKSFTKVSLVITIGLVMFTYLDARAAAWHWVKAGTGDCKAKDLPGTEGFFPDPGQAGPDLTAVCWDSKTYTNKWSPGKVWCVYKQGNCGKVADPQVGQIWKPKPGPPPAQFGGVAVSKSSGMWGTSEWAADTG